MFLRRKVKKLDEDVTQSFDYVASSMKFIIDKVEYVNCRVSKANGAFNALRDELANNGVIRDIRDLRKRVAYLEDENRKLKTNGVATAINNLNGEVFKTRKEKKDGIYTYSFLRSLVVNGESTDEEEEATLAGKVDAIIAYLGLDVTVKPEEKTEAKVIAKKVTTKKKGKK